MSSIRVTICMGSSCHSRGNGRVAEVLRRYQREHPEIEIAGSLCENRCSEGPVVRIGESVAVASDMADLRTLLDRALEGAREGAPS